MLTAIDGDVRGGGGTDRFRIKIWEIEGDVVYDNQLGSDDSAALASDGTAVLQGGNIVIHESKK